MILDAIINMLLWPVWWLINSVPAIEMAVNVQDSIATLVGIIAKTSELIPIASLLPILYTEVSLYTVRFAWGMIRIVKSFIPTMGF